MSILRRFKDIMTSNIHALLDKAEDPEKMIDQYLRNLNNDLGKVKAETATIMAEERRVKRELNECQENIEKMQNFAIKALEEGSEEDARKFLEEKATYEQKEEDLTSAVEIAETNTAQMKEMHDKLLADINELEGRRSILKGKAAVAKTQKRMNELGQSVQGANASKSAFEQMEEKINKSLDEAQAMAELNKSDGDLEDLVKKYESASGKDIDAELEALKQQISKNKE